MRIAFLSLLWLIGILLVLGILTGFVLNWRASKSDNQLLFTSGTLPDPAPDGFLRGSVGRDVSWQGKKFSAADNTGINQFLKNGAVTEAYPFATLVTVGLKDDRQVLQINYDIPQNPWYVRLITDEIVQIASGKYLGKVHVRMIPGFPLTLGYFRLEK